MSHDPARHPGRGRRAPASTRTVARLERLEERLLLSIAVADTRVTEIKGGTNALFVVSLSAPSAQPVSVDYVTRDGSAVAGVDYTTSQGTVKFAPGETGKVVSVPVLDDNLQSGHLAFFLDLLNPIGDSIGRGEATATITTDNNPPFIVVGDVSVPEGAAGAKSTALFNVMLSSTSPTPVTVNYSTANGTALAGVDYTAATGLVTFAPGQTVQTVPVTVLGNNVFENDKTFTLQLSGPTNATIAVDQGTGTILNDDAPPAFSVSSATASPPASGITDAAFTVTLAGATALPATVHYATSDVTAAAGIDYQAVNGTLTFQPGQTSQTVLVPILPQTVNKSDLTFNLTLNNPGNATLATAQGVGTIKSKVAEPTVSVGDTAVTKPSFGTTLAPFTVRLSAPSGQPVNVPYSTADGTAVANVDYTPVSGVLTFAPGQTVQTVTVPVLGNPLYQTDKGFALLLGTADHALPGKVVGVGVIHNAVPPPALSVADTLAREGSFTTTSAVFTVTLSPASNATTTVHYATSNITAVAGVNYTAVSGTLTFAPGQAVGTVTVPILDDLKVHGNQTFALTLSAPSNATLARAQAVGTIIENDSLAVTTTSDGGPGSLRQAITRANAGAAPAVITFAIPGPGPFRINLRSALPEITAPLAIDATTQTGYAGSPVVELNGSGAGEGVNGLTISAGNSVVRGLDIDQFTGSGVFLEGRGGDVIQADYLGTDLSGTALRGNKVYGVLIDNAPNNLIGGPTPQDRNVISGNALGGVYVGFAGASGNLVFGNYIGTDVSGKAAVPNALNGVFVDNAPNNQIGAAGLGNVVSGNVGNGVQIYGPGSSLNRVSGNLIGVSADRSAALPNGGAAIVLSHTGRPHNIVGGPTAADLNVVVAKPHRPAKVVVHAGTKKK
jgi:hypothetical protein